MLLAMFVKATAGIAAYVLFSRKFVSVLNDMALYEETIRYKPDSGSGFPILTLTLWAVFRSLATTAYIASRYLMYQEISVQQPKALALAVSSVWSVASLFVVYVISNEVYSLATMMYGVLTEYLRHLSDLTQSIMKSETSLCSSKAGFALQKLRLEYLKLRMIVGGLNDILPYSMLVSVTCSLVLLCTSAYVVTHPGDSWRKHVFSTCYGINLILELFKLVQASTNLKKKALKMHEMLDAIPTYHVPSHVIAQIHLFKESMDCSQLCLNAFGLFTLDKSLLLSMAASVLTFTILLVQTGQEYKTG
ncbi:uncharacterized protein LOC144103626 [Amblyomma americanum]